MRDLSLLQGRRGSYPLISKSNILVMLTLLVTLITACAAVETHPNADNNVTAEEVAGQTAAVEGQVVTIRSDIVKQVDESAFTVQEIAPGDEILVINISGKPFVLPEEALEVQVTGEVQTFGQVDIERDYNLVLDPDVYAEFEGKPALLAKSLALAPEPGDVTQNPEKFYDREIAVEGEVEDIIAPSTFTLDEERLFGATDLLVIGVPVTKALDGETVVVTGKLRQFILTEFERDYDLTWDLDIKKKLEAEYSDKPVFVADSLYPNA